MEIQPAALPIRVARIVVRGTGVVMSVLGCLTEFLLRHMGGPLSEQTRIETLHRWSKRTLYCMGVTIRVEGTPPATGLIASNHLSYIDIIVYSATAPCAFIAKREVRSWPAVGWVATMAGSIYVDRSQRSEAHAIQPEIQAALASNLRLVLFPEGTSTDGSQLLRFHSSLFQPAIDLQAPVSAACIAYTVPDGVAATDACYWGTMTLVPHLMNLLGKHSVQAKVKFSSKTFRFADRKEAAQQMYREVERLRSTQVEATV
jgi:1-acyl-sn-glycerol-3-phosphate acyltransferase